MLEKLSKKIVNIANDNGTLSTDMSLSNSSQRYTQWTAELRKNGLLSDEYLLPKLEVPCTKILPDLMSSGEPSQETGSLEKQIENLGPWGYGIQLCDNVATEKTPVSLARMTYRSHLITGAVREILGDEISKTTVLDMACNHGYFALDIAYHGAKNAIGVDLRQENINKALFLKQHFKISNTDFMQKDIYDLDSEQKFDVVYNLGLFYHITDPYTLMQKTYDMCTEFAVVDSIMHKMPASVFVQRLNKDTSHHAEGEFSVELHPTYRAMIDLMHAVGFKKIIEVVPADDENRASYKLYDSNHRRCLIGFK
ncbi:MAG: SAM-dependent methyltransferase [Bacteroidia bacterium]|jgi:SAM-dependent methyltransferase